jgi:hypothetical protein
MTVIRVIVAGTVGAGKSTFVQTVGEMGVVCTDRLATDETALLKPTTTVAFDFSRVHLSPDLSLHVYGTPGQYRFNFMWEILMQQAQLCLLLVAAHRPQDFESARKILAFIQQRSASRANCAAPLPIVVGLTHTDCPNVSMPAAVMAALGYSNPYHQPPLVTVNPHDKASVLQALTVSSGLASVS